MASSEASSGVHEEAWLRMEMSSPSVDWEDCLSKGRTKKWTAFFNTNTVFYIYEYNQRKQENNFKIKLKIKMVYKHSDQKLKNVDRNPY